NLEAGLNEHHDNPVLKPTYQPTVLARADSLSQDISFLLGTTAWQFHPIYIDLKSSSPAPLLNYTSRLSTLASSRSTSGLLLAHAYVRYLGDLSGGQIIRKRIAKAYDLSGTGGGVRFYIFPDGNGKEAGPKEMKELKDWYRSGMDAGVGDDEELKELLVEEAVQVFKLNQDLFTLIRGPSEGEALDASDKTPLTEPPTPITLLPAHEFNQLSSSRRVVLPSSRWVAVLAVAVLLAGMQLLFNTSHA
ncbi:1121_t:CDS:2, partial [Acaulospora colombiana]